MIKNRSQIILFLASFVFVIAGVALLKKQWDVVWLSTEKDAPFWDGYADKQISYIYAPGLMGSEILMGRLCPEYTAVTGEKITFKKGGHVIGQPHTCVVFPDVNLKKPTCFTFNPFTAFMNGLRIDLFPLAYRYFCEKYGITVLDNPQSPLSVANYMPRFSHVNAAQKEDINALIKAYQNHRKTYPDGQIVLYGDSRGAATIFNFIALHKPENVKAAVLEGIFDTIPHCVKHFLYENKSNQIEKRLDQLLCIIMHKYRKNGITPWQCSEIIKDSIPLLLVTSLKDGLVPPQSTIKLYKKLVARGHKKVHILVLKNSLHPTYMLDDAEDKILYETVVHAFYKAYNLPHNKVKAMQGQKAFAQTQPMIQEFTARYELAVCPLCDEKPNN